MKKDLLKLKLKKYRNLSAKYLVEGRRLVKEALKSNLAETVYFVNQVGLPVGGVPKFKISSAQAEKLAETESSQGIFAVVKKIKYSLAELTAAKIIYCEEIQDPGNLGTIIRSADAAGFGAVLLSGGSVDLYNSKVLRAAMGSSFHLPVISGSSAKELQVLKEKGYKIIVAAPKGKVKYFEADYSGKIILVFGNEGGGVSRQVEALADQTVSIPILGQAESLNVAAAAAILMYEGNRSQWKKN